MEPPRQQEITQLLEAWSDGRQEALEQLVPIAQVELQRIARRYLNQQRPGHLLQTSALINEANLRLIDWKSALAESRAFFRGCRTTYAAHSGR